MMCDVVNHSTGKTMKHRARGWSGVALLMMSSVLVMAIDPAVGFAQVRSGDEVRVESDPRQHLEEILNRPMYQKWRTRRAWVDESANDAERGWIIQWMGDKLDAMFSAIGRWFRGIFSGWGGSSARAGGGTTFISMLKMLPWVAGGLAIVLIAWIVWRLYDDPSRTATAGKILSRQRVREAMERGEALALSGAQWLDEASRLAGDGDFRAVYRALYLSALSSLHDAGKIDFRRNRTNWRYVGSFRGSAEDRDNFTQLTELFDEVWYGQRPAHEHSLEAVKRRLLTLIGKDGGGT